MIRRIMKLSFFACILLFIVYCLIGCAPEHKIVRDKIDKSKTVETYRKDINKDGIREVISMEERDNSGENVVITICKEDKAKTKLDSIAVEGIFKRIRFVDLNGDQVLALAIFSLTPEGAYRLIIYKLSDDGLKRVFSITSKCGIDADFSSPLSRIKVVKPNRIAGEETCDGNQELDTWIWSGERYIKG